MARTFTGHYLDGRTAARRRAAVTVAAGVVHASLDDGTSVSWPLAEVRQTQGAYAGEPVRLERGGPAPEALVVDDPTFLTALRAAAPARRRFHDPRRRPARRWLTALAALAILVVGAGLYFRGIPVMASVMAAALPLSWEERLGQTVVGHLAPPERRCADPERLAALTTIVERLMAAAPGTPYRIRLTVLDHPAVNALAAPGGHVIVLRGLLERTRTPEELAGVLAHEIQHVVRRHTTRALFAHVSMGVLVAAVAGDLSGLAVFGLEGARVLGSLRYSREAEEEADARGLGMLLAAGVDPRGMLDFFETLRRREGQVPEVLRYLSSHPATEDRVAALRRLAAAGGSPPPTPLLPGRDWADISRLCGRR